MGSTDQRPRSVGRRIGRLAKRVSSRVSGSTPPVVRPPRLSVIVDAGDADEPFLAEAVRSILRQRPKRLEVVLSLTEPAAAARRVADALAADDQRVRVLAQAASCQEAARSAGLDASRGDCVSFVHGSDVVPPGAYAPMMASLDETGSAFVVGRRQVRRGLPDLSRIGGSTHRAVTIEQLPAALFDLAVENKIFRRDFWAASMRASTPLEAVVNAYLAAPSFDVVATTSYVRHDRAVGMPIGTQRPQIPELADWAGAVEAATTRISQAGGLDAAWSLAVLGSLVVPFLNDSERADAEQWSVLRRTVAIHRDRVDAAELATLDAETKVKVWLAAYDHHEDLVRFVAERWYEAPHVETVARNATVVACLPTFGDSVVGVPDDCFEMAPSQLVLQSLVRGARWLDHDTLLLDVWAYITYVDMGSDHPVLHAYLHSGSDRVEVRVDQHEDAGVTRWANDRYQSYDRGAFQVRIDVSGLREPGRTWSLELELMVAGIGRAGQVGQIDRQGSAGLLSAVRHGEVRIVPRWTGTTFELAVIEVTAVLADVSTTFREVRGRLEPGHRARTVRAACGDLRVDAPIVNDTFVAVLARTPARRGILGAPPQWDLTWAGDGFDGEPLVLAGSEAIEGDELMIATSGEGTAHVLEMAGRLLVESVTLSDSEVVITARWPTGAPPDYDLTLESASCTLRPSTTTVEQDLVRSRFACDTQRWGVTAPLASGRYRLIVESDAGRSVALASQSLLAGTGTTTITRRFRFDLRKGAGPWVVLAVSAPLRDDELGVNAQERLRTTHAGPPATIDPLGVYLESYGGRTASDSQLALHEELVRRDAGHTLYWGVADHSVVLPEGAVPLVLGSTAWYERLPSMTYLVNNVDFDRRFVKQPHQRFLQTFHGYPAKAMGIGFWQAKRYTPRRIAAERRRTVHDWDLIVTPTAEMNEHYRREYGYDGPIFDRGLPRDDVLVSTVAEQVRSRTRDLLGIGPDQVAVLYAPTWRDDIATGYESAPGVTHLDPAATSADLGDGFVLLMRGHRFHQAGAGGEQGGARIVDVTDYPEINDLVLASDAGVFDYSSIRFDFALTGRPMIFLVPDLMSYTSGGRGFLFPFEESAPGPLLTSPEEVVAALRDLDEVSARFSDDYRAFNARFNKDNDGHAADRLVDAFFFGQDT